MVAEGLKRVLDGMEAASIAAGRSPDDVTLVAVSKGHSPAEVMEAYEQGHRDFGENRAPELAEKAALLPDDIRWHFIGSLQTRQAKIALPHTILLHSLDRPRLVRSWAAADNPPPALVQVNVAAEPQKHGVEPAQAAELLELAAEQGIECRGLMCIPPLVTNPEDNRQWFAALRRLRDDLVADWPGLHHLSMGMTDDYRVAISEGATLIRVGRAIFGEPAKPARND